MGCVLVVQCEVDGLGDRSLDDFHLGLYSEDQRIVEPLRIIILDILLLICFVVLDDSPFRPCFDELLVAFHCLGVCELCHDITF